MFKNLVAFLRKAADTGPPKFKALVLPLLLVVWTQCRPVLKFFLRVVWFLLGWILRILSFGKINFSKLSEGEISSSVIAHIWGLLWPYLISTRLFSVTIPRSIDLPLLSFAGWERGRLKGWFWTLASVIAFASILNYANPLAARDILQWVFPVSGERISFWGDVFSLKFASVLASLVVLHICLDAILARLPLSLPVFRRKPKAIRLPFGGVTVMKLPELVMPWLFIALIGIGCWEVNSIGVLSVGYNGDLMTALQKKDAAIFYLTLHKFGVIMAIMLVLGAVYTMVKEFLILSCTRFATGRLLEEYADGVNQPYYVIALRGSVDNPNERIQQDLPELLRQVLLFLYEVQDSIITLIKYVPLLWGIEQGLDIAFPMGGHTVVIEHLMMTALIVYAILGSNGAAFTGRKLIGKNAEQRKRAAYFRVQMVLFEKYAEPIAAYRGEASEREHLWSRFTQALSTNYAIVRWSMLLNIFTGAYGRVAQFLPLLCLAPFYFNGHVEMGEISKAAGYCAEILAALSLIASGFDRISAIFAYGNRVGELRDELKRIAAEQATDRPRIHRSEAGCGNVDTLLSVEHVDLYTPGGEHLIVRDLDLVLNRGESTMIIGPSGSGKTTILRAVAGLKTWDCGSGEIRIVPHDKSMMLSQLAYLPTGVNLRGQLMYTATEPVADDVLIKVMDSVNLSGLVERFCEECEKLHPGWHQLPEGVKQDQLLGMTINWDTLSGGEKQRLVTARALVSKVELVLADEATSGLDIANEERLYRELQSHGVTMLSVGHRPSLVQFHKYVVRLLGDGLGGWHIMPADQVKW
jgi:putative ATP-binding cassette transporter